MSFLDAITGSALASTLKTATGAVEIGSSPAPIAGATLVAIDSEHAQWIDTGAGITLATATPAPISVAAGSVGTTIKAAREDHMHLAPTASPVALVIGGTNSAGSAASLARSDHAHALPAAAPPVALAIDSVQAAGSASTLARSDHVHAMPGAGAPAALPVGSAQATGVATTIARSDHVHATPAAGAPVAITIGAVAAAGVATTIARSDHVHPAPALASTTVDGFMAATDKLKLNGVSPGAAALSDATPAAVSGAAALPGGAADASRSDHRHTVSTGTPVALIPGGTNVIGAAATLARSDHAHSIPAFGAISGTFAEGSDVRLSDDRTASGIRTATTIVAVAASAAPSAGSVLIATGASAATWQAMPLSSTTPQPVGAAGAVGAGTTQARADHVHAHGAQTDGTMHAIATGSVAGFLSSADKTKLDTVATSAAALTSTAPVAVGTAAVVGVATVAARGDHVHAHGAQTDGTLHAAATTSVAGFLSTADKTRLDGMSTGAAALTSTAPATVGSSNTVGVATVAARGDHVHAHGAQTDGTMHAIATGSVAGFLSSADKTKLDGVEAGAQVVTFSRVQTALAAASSAIAFNAQRLSSVASPTADTDATTRGYDKLVWPLKASVKAASTAPIAFTGAAPSVVDGVTLALNDRVLVKDGGNGSLAEQNGIYTVQTLGTGANGTWVRSADADTSDKLQCGARVWVIGGTANGSSLWELQTFTQSQIPIDAGQPIGWVKLLNYADKTKLDAIATGAAAVGSTAATQITVATAGAGAATTAARSDHVHSVSTGSPVALAIGGAAADGVATSLARSDHAHAMPAAAAPVVLAIGGANAAGSAATLARSDHAHGMPALVSTSVDGFMSAGDKVRLDGMATGAAAVLSVTPLQVDGSSGNGGAAVTASRSDHRHQVTTGTPVALAMGAATSAGTSNNLTRADHVHALPASGTPVALTLAGTTAPGSAATLALSDHVHALPATAAPVALTPGASNAAGVATTLVRSDHVHSIPAFGSTAGTFCDGADIRLNGVNWKDACQWVALTNVSLTGLAGSAVAGDRVLVAGQTTASQNGIWVAGSGAWARATDAASSAQVTLGLTTNVIRGAYGGTSLAGGSSGPWYLAAASASPIVLGTTGLTFWPVRQQLRAVVSATPSPGEFAFLTTEAPPAGPVTLPSANGAATVGAVVGVMLYTEGGTVRGPADGSAKLIGADNQVYTYPAEYTLTSGYTEWVLVFRASDTSYQWLPRSVAGGIDPLLIEQADFTINATQHAVQTAPTLHALATTSAAGFMSATDKSLLAALLSVDPSINGYRLAPSVDDSPVADGAFSTIYLAPVRGNLMALWNGTAWVLATSSVTPYTVAGRTTDLPFDVFAYSNAGVITLEVLNWSTATARATGITRTSGVWTKVGDQTRRYLGTCRPRSATTYQLQTTAADTTPPRCDLWNVDNQIMGRFRYERSWTPETFTHPTANTWVAWNGVNSRFEFIQGVAGNWLRCDVLAGVQSKTFYAIASCNLDSTSTPSGSRPQVKSTNTSDVVAASGTSILRPSVGVHYVSWNIWAENVAVVWWAAQATHTSGMTVEYQW